MAKIPYTDVLVSVNGNDISDHVKGVTLEYSADMQDVTCMGDGTHINLASLKNWSLNIDLMQDFASSNVDSILFPLVGGSAVTVIVRSVKGTSVGAGNPNFTGSAILQSYGPVSGSVGDAAMTQASFVCAGTLSRANS